jgi:hypothetical protein
MHHLRYVSTSLKARLENTSLTFFHVKQVTRSAWFWDLNQETIVVILRSKSSNCSYRVWGPNWKTRSHQFWGQIERNCGHWFQGQTGRNCPSGFKAKPLTNRPNGFDAKPLTNHWPWFWVLKKPVLLISTCTVQTAHGVTRPPDHSATVYPTCATISGPLHQVSYFLHDPHRCPPCRTCHLHTMRQANTISKWNKDKVKQSKCPEFEFKHQQVNDSLQSNQGIDHLVSQSPLWWVYWWQKAQSLKSNPKPHEAQLEDQKAKKNSRRSSTRRRNRKANKSMKSGKPSKMAKKS